MNSDLSETLPPSHFLALFRLVGAVYEDRQRRNQQQLKLIVADTSYSLLPLQIA